MKKKILFWTIIILLLMTMLQCIVSLKKNNYQKVELNKAHQEKNNTKPGNGLQRDNNDKNEESEKTNRYKQIKDDLEEEIKNYTNAINNNCKKSTSTIITNNDLIYNAGMAKEKLLDVDGKSYCKTYILVNCIEDGTWNWNISISCKDYQDEDYVEW